MGHLWEEYKQAQERGENTKDILDKLKLERYCCRSIFLGQVDLIDTSAEFRRG